MEFSKALLLVVLFSPSILGSIVSSLLPKVDYLPDGTYTSYLKGALCRPSEEIRYPQSISEVVSIVKEAISKGTTVKAFGHRHSITDIICTDGIPVDMRGIQGFVFNAEDNTATVGAGMYLRDFTTKLREAGRALKTTPAFGNITIGGAIGTGAHGSTIKYNSSISAQVVGVTIVDGLGDIREITDKEDLKAFRLHLGLLGIIVKVTLNTEPLYKTKAFNYIIDDDVMTNGKIIDIARSSDQVTVYWYPTFKKVLIGNWTIVDAGEKGNAITADHVPPTSATFNSYAVPALEIFQSLNSLEGLNVLQGYIMQTMIRTVPDFAPIYSEDGVTVVNPATGYYDLMFAPTCKDTGLVQCIWNHTINGIDALDNEISVPLDRIADYSRAVQDILKKSPAVFPFDGIVLRFSGSNDIHMSTSQGRDVCHFEFYTIKRKNPYEDPSTGLAAYQAIMQLMTQNYTGRSHWGKSGLFYHSQEMITKKLDPVERDAFVSKMDQYDPNGIFLNSFGRRLKSKTEIKIDTDSAVTHCALLDSCLCATDTDCANGQICTRIPGYPDYPVCDYRTKPLVDLDVNAYNFSASLSLNKLICSANLGPGITKAALLNLKCPLLGAILG